MGTGRAASLTPSLPLQPRHGGRAALTPARDNPGDGGGCTVPGKGCPRAAGDALTAAECAHLPLCTGPGS